MPRRATKNEGAQQPADDLLGPEQLRALEEEHRRHDADPATREHGLQACRAIYAMLADADELADLDQLPAGDCEECGHTWWVLYRYGGYQLCRSCVVNRLHARAKAADAGDAIQPPPEKPADFHAWIRGNAKRLTRRALDLYLDDWGIARDDDVRLEARDILADAGRQLETAAETRARRRRRRDHHRQDAAA